MSSPNDNGELRRAVSRNETFAEWGGAAVVFGLVVEVVLTSAYHHGESIIEAWGPVFADILIALGVAVEILFARKARSKAEKLQRLSDEKIAEANEHAAKADLARVELEKQLAPRMLNQEQWDLIQSFRGKFETVNIAYETDAESWWFAMELQKSFALAGITSAMFSRDPSVHSFSIMIFEPSGFDGSRARTTGPLIELFDTRHQLSYGSAAIIGGLPTDVLKHAGDDEEALAFLQHTPMILVGGRFIVPPSHWPRPKPKIHST